MKKFFGLIVIFFVVITGCYSDTGGISWYKNDDLPKALKDAAKQDRYIMIDVYTDWCSWCKTLDEETYSDPSVIALSKQFVNIKINPERSTEEQEFACRFNVTGYPTILFIDKNQNLVAKVGGFLPPEEFSKKMDAVLGAGKLEGLYKAYEGGDIESAYEIVSILEGLERLNEAGPLLVELDSRDKLTGKEKERYYNIIGMYYMEKNENKNALNYFKSVMEAGVTGKDQFQLIIAVYYSAVLMAGQNQKKEARDLLTVYINNPSIENKMKQYLIDLKGKL